MARAIDWRQYDRLKAQGLADREIARRWGIPWTTFYREKSKRQGPPAPGQTPVQMTDTGAEQRVDTDAEQRMDTGAVSRVATGAGHGLDTAAVQRLDQLEAAVQSLTTRVQSLMDRLERQPVSTPVQSTTLPPYPKGKAGRWNVWILEAIRAEIASLAAEREMSPSQLMQEVLWQWLTERRRSTPEGRDR
jgi:hypothetical protein